MRNWRGTLPLLFLPKSATEAEEIPVKAQTAGLTWEPRDFEGGLQLQSNQQVLRDRVESSPMADTWCGAGWDHGDQDSDCALSRASCDMARGGVAFGSERAEP